MLLSATLRSILAQTDPDFRVLVAGQDQPDIPELNDPRVRFLAVSFPVPDGTDIKAGDGDKYQKIRLMMRESLLNGADAIAVVDADDRVSRRLVDHFRKFPHPNGYVFEDGYAWDYALGYLATSDDVFRRPFHKRCGSCCIVALADARRRLENDIDALEEWLSGFVRHAEIAETGKSQGRPFAKLPFPGAIYVLNHGIGLSYRGGWRSAARDRRHIRIRNYRIDVTSEMREEFSLFEEFSPGVPRRWRIFNSLTDWPDRTIRSARAWSRKIRGRTKRRAV